jgi:hypothetical protein
MGKNNGEEVRIIPKIFDLQHPKYGVIFTKALPMVHLG